MKFLGHEFQEMNVSDWKTFAGAEEGTLIAWVSGGSIALLLSLDNVLQEVRFDNEGRIATFSWTREEINVEPGYNGQGR